MAADAPIAAPPPPRPFVRGWLVVAGVFVVLATTSGLGFYNLTLYLRAISEERGLSIGAVSGATALFFTVSGLSGVGVAALLARYDARIVMVAGAVIASAALFTLGHVTTLPGIYLTYAVFAVGYAGCALVPGTTLVTRWFHRGRAAALAVASTGLSIGGIALTQLSARWLDGGGLAHAMPSIASLFLLGTVPAVCLLVSPDPRRYGLLPDGAPAPRDGSASTSDSGVRFERAVRTRFFRGLTAAYVLVFLAQVGAVAHLSPLVAERAGKATAALAVSCVAGASILGRLVGGWIATRASMRAFALGLLGLQTLALLALAGHEGRTGALVAATLFGVTVGNLLMLHPLLVAEAFGVRDYARIFSTSQLVTTLGVAGGPLLLGLLHDFGGGYGAAYTVASGAGILAIALLARAGPIPAAGDDGAPLPAEIAGATSG